MMKQILAIPAEAAAMPPKPRIAAIIAMTKNTQAYQSMQFLPSSIVESKSGAKLRQSLAPYRTTLKYEFTMGCNRTKKIAELAVP